MEPIDARDPYYNGPTLSLSVLDLNTALFFSFISH